MNNPAPRRWIGFDYDPQDHTPQNPIDSNMLERKAGKRPCTQIRTPLQ